MASLSYMLVFSAHSPRELYKATSTITRALELNYRLCRTLKETNKKYSPPASLSVPSFRKVRQYRAKNTRFGLIRSPFVHKKSGETFFYSYYNAEIPVEIDLKEGSDNNATPVRDPQGMLRFLLRNYPCPLSFRNVELRVKSLEANYDDKNNKLLDFPSRPSLWNKFLPPPQS
mmetsp:Transcript_31746/g.53716  ORF Transcript_31746/g.53716 Transcript_31746/m.53716 type:complete len:173 (-) Transcript_31746:274-792(-)|eukprot:jgi/Bigna1/66648/fgenesh1_pg.2_\